MTVSLFPVDGCQVIAEAGQCHGGSVTEACSLAWHAMQAGARYVKFQLLRPETIAAPAAPKYWDDPFGTADQRAAFETAGLIDYGSWREVAAECRQYGIGFTATPFDLEAVRVLDDLDVPFYKIASGDLTYRRLLDEVAATGRPIVLSTGAATADEIARTVDYLLSARMARCVVPLACTLSYPTPDNQAHLARIPALRTLTGLDVGLSDHTTGVDTALAAAAAGAVVLEKHYSLNAGKPGTGVADDAMAVDPGRLADYVALAERGATLRGSPALAPCAAELAARSGARRSVHAARDLRTGERVAAGDVVELRPGGGVDAWDVDQVIGSRCLRDVRAGERF